MKLAVQLSVLMSSMLLSFSAMGGQGIAGGFGKTRFLLQSFAFNEAILTIDGITNIPETDTTPKLVIPEDEYKQFIAEVEKQVATKSEDPVLEVELKDGTVRRFTLHHVGEVGKEPLFLYLIEEKCAE